ncbi:bifunctional DNA-binding transcriptional regulator/O6-methylguanine-DNA methyltransferase Ada [Kushneria aurantia]|uniref:Bifunctional DNA-binding transcriptional regulator/O6-methylguanine-DNA methyltransferase Ada n=1 Tax=Kushneria aurantia TaxID=504092 RepID=A0ABV6G3F5_9GAMM|nr:bifunctional DNA-binding transcriptional regulator/O6-methylguanine-DNA methyltransferase Ada [Kushneria aurantia]
MKVSNSRYANEDERWEAILGRDVCADEHFVYAVITTGVYGPPSAVTKLPRRENVRFFDTSQEAENAGYRPSRRASPDRKSIAKKNAERITKVCREIHEAEQVPSLEKLAEWAEMSPFHFHRVFKRETGITPRAYIAATRSLKIRQQLTSGDNSITDAIYDSGFNSNSRFYEASYNTLGMKPKEFRSGGKGQTIKFAVGQCSLGAILVAQSCKGICSILLGPDPQKLILEFQDSFSKAELVGGDENFEKIVANVVGFVESPSTGFNLPLDIQGTVFQEKVWQALREIPYGEKVSYSEIAKRIGSPKAVRAVAKACASNRLAIAIPCHRVVKSNGDISGYRWGVEIKQKLLEREEKR